MKTLKLYIASSLTVFLILMTWKNFYSINCFALIFPLIVLIFISQGYIEYKMQERICIKKCFFNEQSIIAVILSSRIFVILIYTFLSVLMTISMMHSVIEYPQTFWFYLFVHIALVILLYKLLAITFSRTLKGEYLFLFVREWTFNISALWLILIYVYFEFEYGYLPGYLNENLSRTIINASNSFQSNCQIINIILKVKTEVDSIFWWMLSEKTDYFDNEMIKIGIWFGFLLINALALLGLSKLIVQIVYFLDKIFTPTAINPLNEIKQTPGKHKMDN